MSASSTVNAAAGTRFYFTNNYTLLDGAQLAGAGLFNQTAGTLTIDGALRAANFTWSGGNWNTANNSGFTSILAPGTTLNLTNANDSYRDFNGRAIVNQGTVNWSSAYIRGGNGSTFTNAAGATFNDLNASSYTINNPFGGTFTFRNDGLYNKTTAGTTTFSIPVTNTGTMNVTAGALVFSSTFTNSGALALANGASLQFSGALTMGTAPLSGTGTISAPGVTAGGLVSPGTSPGTLTLTGNLTLLGTSTLLIELGGMTQGTGYDFLNVGGNAVLAGGLSLTFTNGFQSTVLPGNTFTVLTAAGAGGLTGTFGNISNGQRLLTLDGAGSFQVNFGTGSAFGANSIVLSNFVAVPEPSTYALLGLGSLAVILAGCRRRVS